MCSTLLQMHFIVQLGKVHNSYVQLGRRHGLLGSLELFDTPPSRGGGAHSSQAETSFVLFCQDRVPADQVLLEDTNCLR